MKKKSMQQCFSLNAEKTKIGDHIKNADPLIVLIISGLKNVIISEEKTKIGSGIQISKKYSITNCLTSGKRPWMESSKD